MQQSAHRSKLVVTDAVFSMDGDLAPLPQTARVVRGVTMPGWSSTTRHGFGVLGQSVAGSLGPLGPELGTKSFYVGTLGKAAGVFGPRSWQQTPTWSNGFFSGPAPTCSPRPAPPLLAADANWGRWT